MEHKGYGSSYNRLDILPMLKKESSYFWTPCRYIFIYKCTKVSKNGFIFVRDLLQKQIEEMPEEEFSRHKEALATQKLEKPKRLSTLFNKFLIEIGVQQYHFNRAEIEVAILQKLTKKDLFDFYTNFVLSTGKERTTLSIHIVSTADGGVGRNDTTDPIILATPEHGSERRSNTNVINDLAVFKSSKELYPMVQPYIDITPKGAKSKL